MVKEKTRTHYQKIVDIFFVLCRPFFLKFFKYQAQNCLNAVNYCSSMEQQVVVAEVFNVLDSFNSACSRGSVNLLKKKKI